MDEGDDHADRRRSVAPVLRDYVPSSGQPVEEWLAAMAQRHGLVPEDEPYRTVDELGISVLRFAMVRDEG